MRKVAQTTSKCGAMSIEHNVNAAAVAQHDVVGFVIKHPKSNALAHPYTCIHTQRQTIMLNCSCAIFEATAGGRSVMLLLLATASTNQKCFCKFAQIVKFEYPSSSQKQQCWTTAAFTSICALTQFCLVLWCFLCIEKCLLEISVLW